MLFHLEHFLCHCTGAIGVNRNHHVHACNWSCRHDAAWSDVGLRCHGLAHAEVGYACGGKLCLSHSRCIVVVLAGNHLHNDSGGCWCRYRLCGACGSFHRRFCAIEGVGVICSDGRLRRGVVDKVVRVLNHAQVISQCPVVAIVREAPVCFSVKQIVFRTADDILLRESVVCDVEDVDKLRLALVLVGIC